MSALSLMVHRCSIERNTPTNEHGQIKAHWAVLANPVRCLLQEKAGRLNRGPAGTALEYDAVLFLPPGQEVGPRGTQDRADRIVMLKPDRVADTVFLVLFVADRSGMGNHQTAYVKRYQQEG